MQTIDEVEQKVMKRMELELKLHDIRHNIAGVENRLTDNQRDYELNKAWVEGALSMLKTQEEMLKVFLGITKE